MTRLEQLRKMIGWDVMMICVSRETGLRTSYDGILREKDGVFELWQHGIEPVYRFSPEKVDSTNIVPGFRPALFTHFCEDGLAPSSRLS